MSYSPQPQPRMAMLPFASSRRSTPPIFLLSPITKTHSGMETQPLATTLPCRDEYPFDLSLFSFSLSLNCHPRFRPPSMTLQLSTFVCKSLFYTTITIESVKVRVNERKTKV
ncbi:hypothetical protein CIPAW_05G221400 [Carya illinoinensis]|uniref:Uncharacterized protein n=1 Tax=Carya illinoinensis TaxID=32201 RepID=A0A8T1QM15_CARIL|nr:hypothetical protein CIPAW_05G221400 [Carya illinoinensis]